MFALSGCQSSYDEGYDDGYWDGYEDGLNDADYDYGITRTEYEEAYEEGYDEGYWEGSEKGYEDGEYMMMDNLTAYYYYEHGIVFDQEDFNKFMDSD